MSKSIEELTTEIVVAAINSAMEKPYERGGNGTAKLTTDDVPKLIKEVYGALKSLDTSDSK